MSILARDIRYAVRSLAKSPAFTLVALVTLALGIGINTAIFSVVHGVLLRPLDFPEPGRLVNVWENREKRDGPREEWTGRTVFREWRSLNRTFSGMAALQGWGPSLTGTDRTEVLTGAQVTPGYFAVLGVEPALGRGFLPREEIPGNGDVVVLGHELWQTRLGGDPGIIGQALTLDGVPTTVVGVLPPGFTGPLQPGAAIWSPLTIDPADDDRGNLYLRVIARLAPDVALTVATADMNRVAAIIAAEDPVEYRDVGVTLVPLLKTVVGPVRTPLLVLLGAVGLILLIACANVANLLLARASIREREIAVRMALGARRGQLVRQLLTESLVLASAGGVVGLVLGVWGTDVLVRLAPANMPRMAEVGAHPMVLLFAIGASMATGLLFGLAPALSLSSAGSRATALHGRGTAGDSRGARRLRGALVVGELALGLAVLASAGLLLRSFGELRSVDPGFQMERAVAARIVFPAARYADGAAIRNFMDELEGTLRSTPGVIAVGSVHVLPLSGTVLDTGFGIEDRLPEPGKEPAVDVQRATPGALEALGLSLLAGRWFTEQDSPDGLPVTLVSESLVERHFPGEDPVGKRIRVGTVHGPDARWRTIVGVVGSVRSRGVARVPESEVYLPATQSTPRAWNIVLRSDRDAAFLVPQVRDALRSMDRDMAVSQVATLKELFSQNIAPQRFVGTLLGAFAALAVTLGAVGIYGVMAFSVSRRTREIGIRMALGASPSAVRGAVLRGGLGLTLAGLALGLAGALAATRALSGLLYRVTPTDPATLSAAAALLAATALFACYWPARRAMRVDPMVSLRDE